MKISVGYVVLMYVKLNIKKQINAACLLLDIIYEISSVLPFTLKFVFFK